jgi:hypothetical protein
MCYCTFLGRLETLKDLAAKGLSAAVYTPLSDVENEVNGFLTYDRTTVQKVSPHAVQRATRKLGGCSALLGRFGGGHDRARHEWDL